LWVNNNYFACPQGIFWQYKFFRWFSMIFSRNCDI
jgi:hypothetical protein